jgi:SAM-dependent methyltransferase
MSDQRPLWATGEAYEPYVGRWSRLVAPVFIHWLDQPPRQDWIDVGCGTGELTRAILATADPRSVRGIEPSDGFIAYARSNTPDERAAFTKGSAQEIPLDDGAADVLVSGLMLNFVPDHAAALAEFARVTRAGGIVAPYVWDYAGEMQMMRHFWDVAGELDSAALEADVANRFAICRPDALGGLFATRFSSVETRSIDVPTVFKDFDDYWTPFLAGQAPAPQYAMSLSEEGRAQLREALRARLPVADDGSIALTARAWAVKGVR